MRYRVDYLPLRTTPSPSNAATIVDGVEHVAVFRTHRIVEMKDKEGEFVGVFLLDNVSGIVKLDDPAEDA